MKHALRVLAVLMLAAEVTASPSPDRALSDDEWRADLAELDRTIREVHFKPFHVVLEKEYAAAVDALAASIPDRTDHEIIVALAKIVALLRDGHTRLHIPRRHPSLALEAELGHSGTAPPRLASLRFENLPVVFGLFEDGLFVTGATPDHADLVGAAVIRIGTLAAADAVERVKATAFFENDSRARLLATDRLALPQVLEELDIAPLTGAVELEVRRPDGIAITRMLTPLDDARRLSSGAPQPPPAWLRQPQRDEWYELLPDRDAIYVQVNRFAEEPPRPYAEFVAETLAQARTAGVTRYVLDLRHNTGGIGAWTIPFVTGLARSEFNAYGRLYVLIGRTTFSAAQHLLHRLEEYTYATFVGEPGGAKPSHFSDPRRFVLDNSGLTLRVSTIYWHSWLANDFREAIEPHVDAPLSSSDFFSGRDPALEAALAYEPAQTLAGQMEEQFRLGKNQNALLLFQRHTTDATLQDHAGAVPDLLAMGHRLLDDGLTRPGFFVFLLTDRTWPGNADTLVALGGAHLAGGRPDEARSAYERALRIAPGHAAARAGLERIEADR